MDNRKQQPFYVGQRVVCMSNPTNSHSLVNNLPFNLEVNNVYIVSDCFIGWVRHNNKTMWGVTLKGHIHTYSASLFAPYDPPAIEIPAELLEVDVKDGIDVKPVKELI